MMVVTWICIFVKAHHTVSLKCMHIIVCKVCLNEIDLKMGMCSLASNEFLSLEVYEQRFSDHLSEIF